MAKQEYKQEETKEVKVENKRTITPCWLVSKANHIIEVQCNGQTLFIQPFGKIMVVKEDTIIKDIDARQLTFVKVK